MSGFSDAERERIREELIQTGRDLLIKYGTKKTTVKDITDPVRIAKPTFYRFFDSKSELYIVIFQRELDQFAEDLHSELAGVEDPREQLERFFWSYVRFGEENKFVQQVFIKGDYQEVIGDLSSEEIVALQRKEMEIMVPYIEAIKQQSDGPISEMDTVTVLGILASSLGLLLLHKDEYDEYSELLEEIDDRFYIHIQENLISILARGLTIGR